MWLLILPSIWLLSLAEEFLLDQMVMNQSSLSVTSFLYNPTSKHSPWVETNLGPQAVFYDSHAIKERTLGNFTFFSEAYFQKISEVMRLPGIALSSRCSVEIMSFVLLGIDDPLRIEWRSEKPSMGKGVLRIGDRRQPDWSCYYRAVYENWRPEPKTGKNYWTVLIYCHPPPSDTYCKDMLGYFNSKHTQRIPVKVTLQLRSTSISADFHISEKHSKTKAINKMDMAVCAVIPYTSSDLDKMEANGAMMFEWIRYYSNLGFKVFIYDRDGANVQHIFYSNYRKNQNRGRKEHERIRYNLVYHDYTILGLLDNSRKHIKSDNGYGKLSNTVTINFNTDKTLTSTHCRFEAKALYNIDNVFVADFDEFLYCNDGKSDASKLSNYIREQLILEQKKGFNSYFFRQRILVNRTESTRDCIIEQVRKGGSASIFDCIAPYEVCLPGHAVKTFHLGNHCPLCTYHEACDTLLGYNCLCDTSRSLTCQLVHFTTVQKVVNERQKFNIYDPITYKDKKTELWYIANIPNKDLYPSTMSTSIDHAKDCIIHK